MTACALDGVSEDCDSLYVFSAIAIISALFWVQAATDMGWARQLSFGRARLLSRAAATLALLSHQCTCATRSGPAPASGPAAIGVAASVGTPAPASSPAPAAVLSTDCVRTLASQSRMLRTALPDLYSVAGRKCCVPKLVDGRGLLRYSAACRIIECTDLNTGFTLLQACNPSWLAANGNCKAPTTHQLGNNNGNFVNGEATGPFRLPTRWSCSVDPHNPLPEYPRPQLVRQNWESLNGVWEWQAAPCVSCLL